MLAQGAYQRSPGQSFVREQPQHAAPFCAPCTDQCAQVTTGNEEAARAPGSPGEVTWSERGGPVFFKNGLSIEAKRLFVFIVFFFSPLSSSQVTLERVRGDLRHDGEDSDLDLPDKRVHSHGTKGESSLLLHCPLLDS